MSLWATAFTASLAAFLVWRGTGSWLKALLDWIFVLLALPIVALAAAAFVSVEFFRIDYHRLSPTAIDQTIFVANVVAWAYLAWLVVRRSMQNGGVVEEGRDNP